MLFPVTESLSTANQNMYDFRHPKQNSCVLTNLWKFKNEALITLRVSSNKLVNFGDN